MTDRLLVRPAIQRDEWLTGYKVRVAVANGLTRGEERRIDLRDAGLLPGNGRHEASAGAGGSSGVWGRFVVPGWTVRASSAPAAFCPLCWNEAPYFRLDWRLGATENCWRHRRKLCSECPICRGSLDAFDVSRGCCRAGHGISDLFVRIDRDWGARLATSAESLAFATDEEVASYIILTELACRVSRADRDPECVSSGTLACLLGETRGGDIVLGAANLREVFSGLTDRTSLNEALRLVLRVHRDEAVRPTVMSSLPLWELAIQLVDRGADARHVVRLGLIDRHAVMLHPESDDAAVQSSPNEGVGFGKERDIVLFDNARIGLSEQRLALRGHADWKSRQAARPEPLVFGGRAQMHPGEFDDYLGDVSRVAKPLRDCAEATVQLELSLLWSRASRRQLAALLDDLRSGNLPVWVDPDLTGLARFYVGSRVVQRLQGIAPRLRLRRWEPQMSLAL